MRKVVSLALAVAMICSLALPVSAAGATSGPGDSGGIVLASSSAKKDTRTPSQIGSGSFSSGTSGWTGGTTSNQGSEEEPEPELNFDDFEDIKGHWAEYYMHWAFDNNMFTGISETEMCPDGNITRAQMATVITRAFGATKAADVSMFVDLDREDWCYEPIGQAVQMGFLSGFGNAIVPGEEVNRQEVAVALVKVAGYDFESASSLNRFSDAYTIDSAAQSYMATAVAHNIMTGYGDGKIGPKDKITRAQFAVMMYKIASAYMNADTIFTAKTVPGSLAVSIGNTSLDNMSIGGDLFITDGVGNGTVTLNNTTVGGVVYIRGGSNIYLTNGSSVGRVVFNNPNAAATFRVDDESTVKSMVIRDGNGGVTLTGAVGDVDMDTAKVPLKLSSATVDSLTINAKAAAVTGDKASSIDSISISEEATGAAVDCGGTVGDLFCGASNTTIRVSGALSSLSFGEDVKDVSLTLPPKGTMDEVYLDVDNLSLTFGGTIKKLHIGGDNCDIRLSADAEVDEVIFDGNKGKFGTASGAVISNLQVNGDDDVINLASGTTVKKLVSKGDGLEYTGNATINNFTIESGSDVKVSIPKTTINNKGGKDVYTGDYYIRPGNTVQTNSNGNGDMDTEVEEKNPITSKQFDIKVTCGEGGTITPNEKFQVSGASDQTFVVKCDDGYIVDTFLVDGRPATLDKDGKYTIEDIRENHTLEITFKDDPRYGGYHEKPGTKATWSVKYAAGAMPSDFGFNGQYTLASFGSILAFDVKTGKMSGTVNAIQNFAWYKGDREQYATDYYFPLVLESNYITEHARLKIGDAVFGKEVISTGSRYGGSWMVYVPIDSLATTKQVVISLDPDGDGEMFAENSITIDYSDLRYYGGIGSDTLYRGIKPIPGYDGAETAKLLFGKTTLANEIFETYLSTDALLETRNGEGRYGHWVGLYIPVKEGADNAKIRITNPKGGYSDVVLKAKTVSGMSQPCLVWEVDAGSTESQTSSKTYILDIQWRKGTENIELDGNKKVSVNLSEVNIAGAGGIEATPALADVTLTQMSPGDLIGFGYTMDSFGTGVRVTSKISTGEYHVMGTFFPVNDVIAKEYGGEYLVPMTMTAKVTLPCNIMVGSKVVGNIQPPTPTEEVPNPGIIGKANFFVPVTPYGNTLADIRIVCQPEYPSMQFSNVTVTLDASQTQVYAGGVVFPGTMPTGEINGKPVGSYIGGTDISYDVVGSTVAIRGTLYKQEKMTLGKVTGDLHLAPLSLFVRCAVDWSLEVTGGGENYGTYTSRDSGTSLNILVPVAKDGYKVLNSTLTLKDGEGKVISTTIVTFAGELDGPVELPPIEPPAPEKKPLVSSLSVANMSEESFKTLGITPDTFAENYGASTTSSGLVMEGAYKEVDVTIGGERKTGYQLPLAITMTGVQGSGTIHKLVNGKTSPICGFTAEDAEGKTFDVLVPLTVSSGKIEAFQLLVKADEEDKFTPVTVGVDMSKATVFEETPTTQPVAKSVDLSVPTAQQATTIGITVSDFVTGMALTDGKLTGTFKEVDGKTADGENLDKGYYAPIAVSLPEAKAGGDIYLVTGSGDSAKTTKLKSFAVAASGDSTVIVMVPLTVDGGRITGFTIEARPTDGSTEYYKVTKTVATTSARVEGVKVVAETLTAKTTTAAEAADDSAGQKFDLDDFVDSSYAITPNGADNYKVAGKFKNVEGVSVGGTKLPEGMYLPITITMGEIKTAGELHLKAGSTDVKLVEYTMDDIPTGKTGLQAVALVPLPYTEGTGFTNFTLVLQSTETDAESLVITIDMTDAEVFVPEVKGDIAASFSVEQVVEGQWTAAKVQATDFATGYSVTNTMSGANVFGKYKEADTKVDDKEIKGYYVPLSLKFTGVKAAAEIDLTIDGTTEPTGYTIAAPTSGTKDVTYTAFIPLKQNALNGLFHDFTLTIKATDADAGYTSLTKTVSMAKATREGAVTETWPDLMASYAKSGNGFGSMGTGAVYERQCASCVEDFSVTYNGTETYTLAGKLINQTIGTTQNPVPDGLEPHGWFAPVKIKKPTEIGANGWTVQIWYGGGDTVKHFSVDGNTEVSADSYITTCIPLGSCDVGAGVNNPVKYKGVTVIIMSGDKVCARYVINADAMTYQSMPDDAKVLTLTSSDITG